MAYIQVEMFARLLRVFIDKLLLDKDPSEEDIAFVNSTGVDSSLLCTHQ
jgi:hypothetical protein